MPEPPDATAPSPDVTVVGPNGPDGRSEPTGPRASARPDPVRYGAVPGGVGNAVEGAEGA
ncbi:hypothetical protein [Streptomyces sp. NPDC085479]|uniref:hypothetical protein n=1 Tax=Streptomyces sp. NPDC085479 TaxID=3365726 RepID=UPI0037CFCA69